MERTVKEIAAAINNGDKQAKAELEKMFGKKIKDMTDEEKLLGLSCLSAFDKD